MLVLFSITLLLINIVAGRFGKSIRGLRDFAKAVEHGNLHTQINFPQDELGEISAKIAENYSNLKESKREIDLERDKLLQHVLSSEEGLCFFSANKTVQFYNGLFIQYLNIIIDEYNSNPTVIFTDASFSKVNSFLVRQEIKENYFETQINKQGKTFILRVNIFDDRSFEIILNDITKKEATRRLKQEMIGNITHELRTPVTGIRGCLETILEHQLEPEKKQYFIERAYNQVLALSEIIQDMSLITKIEEAPQSFKLEEVSISELLEQLRNDLEIQLKEKNIRLEWNVDNVFVRGNYNLLYSIFRNLTDNVIRHAGTNINVFINKYNEDKDFYYFSYSDNGQGIPDEQHLNRLFERFYRITEGRTRDTGGSGLGLSIVKNAISFHKGKIVAKNKSDGGLEFLFNLPKP
jgi:signal transduction histidine kinase